LPKIFTRIYLRKVGQDIGILLVTAYLVFFAGQQAIGQEVKKVIIRTTNDLELIAPILERVAINLNNDGYALKTFGLSIYPTPASRTIYNLEMRPYTDEYYGPNMVLRVETPLSLDPSPLLFAQFERFPERTASIDPEAIEHLASLITALSFYSVERCDLATPYFEVALGQLDDYGNLETTQDISPYRQQKNYLVTFLSFFEGNCALLSGDYDRAIAKLQRASGGWHNPGEIQPEPATNLIWTYIRIGEVEKAFTESWLVPEDPFGRMTALSRRALLYLQLSDHLAALEEVNKAFDVAQDMESYTSVPEISLAELYTVRGQIYLNIYEWDKSLADFNMALGLAPDYAEAHYQRGLLYYSVLQTGQELRAEALADFERYLELAPDGPYVEDTRDYVESIEAELAALNS
jgi:tetratricopeptide (TPR) repeat protein